MNGLANNKLNEMVTITCYGKKEKKTRRAALAKYYEGMVCSEDRSTNATKPSFSNS